MDKEQVEQLKIQMQQWVNEAEKFINDIPPVQLYVAVGVVLSTLILLLISKLLKLHLGLEISFGFSILMCVSNLFEFSDF